MRRRLLTAVGLVAVSGALLAAVTVAAQAGTPAGPHLQRVAISLLPGGGGFDDRAVQSNIAIAPGVPVEFTVTNYTNEAHTFTVPGLRVSVLIPAARNYVPRKVSFRLISYEFGTYSWYCVLCESGVHGMRHDMSGVLYAFIDPRVLP